MNRIMVVGGPASGKSTFARKLGYKTGLPVVHLDRIHWKPGWAERDRLEKISMIAAEEAKDRWIIEGGLSATYENRSNRADLIIWLDLPLLLRLVRVVKRRLEYSGGATRPDLPEDCPETLNWEFFSYILSSNRRVRRRHFLMLSEFGSDKMIRLASRTEVARYLDTRHPHGVPSHDARASV